MSFSDEELIAFLLGDADPNLEQRLQLSLNADPDLRDRLADLRQVLGHMDSLSGVYEPPSGLIESTWDRINERESQLVGQDPLMKDRGKENASIEIASRQVLSPANGNEKSRGSTKQKRVDSLVLTACVAVMCCLLLPAVVTARFSARTAGCSKKMQGLGYGLLNQAIGSDDGRFFRVPTSGREAFAGVYAIRLASSGEVTSYSNLLCPSLVGCDQAVRPVGLKQIPSIETLNALPAADVLAWQQSIGGHYAYSLGVLENGQLVAPKCEGRTHFAILADAPIFTERGEEFIAHGGRGINILYEDGRVEFVRLRSDRSMVTLLDYPFRNMSGDHAVGLAVDDMSLAPSHYSPLGVNGQQ